MVIRCSSSIAMCSSPSAGQRPLLASPKLFSRMLLCVLGVLGGACTACTARVAHQDVAANASSVLRTRAATGGQGDGDRGTGGAAPGQRLSPDGDRSLDALIASLDGEGEGEGEPCDDIAEDAEVLGPVSDEVQASYRSRLPARSHEATAARVRRPDTSPAPVRSASEGYAWAGKGGVRRILQAKGRGGKAARRARRRRLLAKLTECNACSIERCQRIRGGRTRCVGKCYKNGKIFTCSSLKNDFRTCQRGSFPWPPATLAIDTLEPLSALLVSAPAPFIPCVETANHPTGCPAPGTRVVHSGLRGRVVRHLESTCVSERYTLQECESPFFPFGYCECLFTETFSGGNGGRVTRPCRIDDFYVMDLPLSSTVNSSADGTPSRVETRVSAHVYDDAEARYSYNASFPTRDGDARVTMEYFRGFSILADRFTYTGEFDTSDYSGGDDNVPDGVVDCSDSYQRDYPDDYAIVSRGDYRTDYAYGDYANGDYRRTTYCYYSGGVISDYSGDYGQETDYSEDDAAAEAEIAALTAEAEEYYFDQRYYFFDEQVCYLQCSFEGTGVLGSVQEMYGVDGGYSVYYDGNAVPSATCPLCYDDVEVAEPGGFEVFLGDVPEDQRLDPVE